MSFFDELDEEDLGECPLKMDAKLVEKFQFPVYEKPGHKDDMVSEFRTVFSFVHRSDLLSRHRTL